MTLLIVLFVLLLILTCFFAYGFFRALKIIEEYESFYDDTLDDLSSVYQHFEALLAKRRVFTDDPDVQEIYRLIGLTHDVLAGYLDDKKRKESKRKKKEKKK